MIRYAVLALAAIGSADSVLADTVYNLEPETKLSVF
jgi:hypothetical protein